MFILRLIRLTFFLPRDRYFIHFIYYFLYFKPAQFCSLLLLLIKNPLFPILLYQKFQVQLQCFHEKSNVHLMLVEPKHIILL